MVTGKGKIKDLLVNAHQLYKDNDDVVVTSYIDITERLIAEQKLRESEENIRAVVDSLPGSVVVIDEVGKIIRTNATWNVFAVENEGENTSRPYLGHNYFEICEKAIGEEQESAQLALKGLKEVLSGKLQLFDM